MKKIELKPIVVTILLIVFQSVVFVFSRLVQGNPHIIGGIIDSKIPFNIWFIIPYSIWYFLIFIVPYYLYTRDKDSFIRYIYAYIYCTLVANLIFIIYPTTVIRPEVASTNVLTWMAHVIFTIDTPPLNCFPSLHFAMSLLFITFICENKNIKKITQIIITIISILIMIATLFVKQHVFIDVVSGVLIATVIYFLVKKFYKKDNWIKRLLKY